MGIWLGGKDEVDIERKDDLESKNEERRIIREYEIWVGQAGTGRS